MNWCLDSLFLPETKALVEKQTLESFLGKMS